MKSQNISILTALGNVLTGRIVSLAIGVVATPLLVRLLGPASYGDYAFAISVLSFTVIVTDVGTSDAVRKFIAELSGDDQTAAFTFYVRLVGITAVIGAGGIAFAGQIIPSTGLLEQELSGLLAIVSVAVLGRAGFRLFRNILMGLGMERISEPLTVLRRGLAELGAVVLAAGGFGLTVVFSMEVIAGVVTTAIALIVVSRQTQIRVVHSNKLSSVSYRRLAGFSLGSWVITILFTSLYHVDLLFVRVVLDARRTGLYRAALQTAEFVWFVPFALQLVLLQSVSERWSRMSTTETRQLTERVTRYTIAATVLVAIGIGMLSEPFLRVYFGTAFVSMTPVVAVLLSGVAGFAIARPLIAIVQASGRLRPLLIGSSVVAVINVVGNALLVPRYGVVGAAVATALSYASVLLVAGWALRRNECLPKGRLGLPGTLTAGVVTAFVLGLGRSLPLGSITTLVTLPPIGAGCYVTVLLTTGVFRPTEVDLLIGRLPGPLGRLVYLLHRQTCECE
jgi:O-antigen/teichoic acid export membrane protein